jgi:predicted phage terminase large subunit-like protein
MIKQMWFRYYSALPERKLGHRIFMSWDTAAKNGAQNDWSVCTVWLLADNIYYLLDMVRGRFEYPQLRDTAIALAERYKPFAILIEDASTGTALAQELKQSGRFPVRLIPIHHDKVGRLYVQHGKFERGLVQLPKDQPFTPEVEKELLNFDMPGLAIAGAQSVRSAVKKKASNILDMLAGDPSRSRGIAAADRIGDAVVLLSGLLAPLLIH